MNFPTIVIETEENIDDIFESGENAVEMSGLQSNIILYTREVSLQNFIMAGVGIAAIEGNEKLLYILSAVLLASLSPYDFKIIPDESGVIVELFEKIGFNKILSMEKITKYIGDKDMVVRGINFLLSKNVLSEVKSGFKLNIKPLKNVKVKFI